MDMVTPDRRSKLKTFALGLGVRLAGVAFIALGDGHDNPWAKALVIAGVVVTVTGMGFLRFLLFQPLLSRIRPRAKQPEQ